MIDTIGTLFGNETVLAMWHRTTNLTDAELASLGFRRIAGSELIYRHSALKSDFSDEHPFGMDVPLDFVAEESDEEQVFREWLQKQKHIEYPVDKQFVGKTIAEVCKQWADHHFDHEQPEDRTFNTFNQPLLDPSGNHALVQFWVEYRDWGYSQVLVLTKRRVEWQLRFVAEDQHWHKQPNAEDE